MARAARAGLLARRVARVARVAVMRAAPRVRVARVRGLRRPFARGAHRRAAAFRVLARTVPAGLLCCLLSRLLRRAAARRSAPPPPPAPSCPWWDVACHAVHAWHTVTHYYHAAVHVVVQTADVAGLAAALRDARGALARGVAVAGHLARDVGTGIADAARAGAHVLGSAWHAAVSAGAAVAHGVTRYASQQYHAVVHAVKTAYHAVARVATATVDFVKHHAAVIASVVVSAAVFIGCDAALGVATGGVGAVAGATACGALAGAAGNASVARDAGSFAPEDASQIASVDTPSGPAAQDASAGAMAARGQVEAGAPLYRVGSMG
ncbi:MAG TPA: hypothetical protein VMV92_07955, partial [Streptosporangiaceae bacterium]|nr:hypothetical protein [Streptosporangiaceae bacterium]